MKSLLTIDPGANGGICFQSKSGEVLCFKIPASLSVLSEMLIAFKKYPELPDAIIEDVGFHQEGTRAQSTATLARQVGQIEMGLEMLGIAREYVRPQIWMRAFPDRPKSLNTAEKMELKAQHPGASESQLKDLIKKANAQRKRERKAYIKSEVQRAFPEVKVYADPKKAKFTHKVTDWCGDALGILLWANQK